MNGCCIEGTGGGLAARRGQQDWVLVGRSREEYRFIWTVKEYTCESSIICGRLKKEEKEEVSIRVLVLVKMI